MTTASLLQAAKRAGLSVDRKAHGRIIITGPGGTVRWYSCPECPPKEDCHSSVYYLRGGDFDDFATDFFPGIYVKTIREAIARVKGA